MKSEKANTKYGIVLSFVALTISLLGTLFVSNRVLNLIGDYNYGLYSFVNSITSWLMIFASAINASYLRYSSIEARENAGSNGKTNTIYFKLLLIMSVGTLVVGLIVLGILYGSHICLGKYLWEDSKTMYKLFFLSLVNISITMPSSVFQLFVNYKKHFVFEKILLILTSVLTFVGHFVIAYFTKNIILISAFSIVLTCINFSANYLYSKRKLDIQFMKAVINDNKSLFKSILVFSSILVLNSVVDQINVHVDKTLLGIFAIPEDVTIYQMGMQFSTYVGTFVTAISGVFAPKITELCINNRKSEIDDLFLKVSRMQAIIVTFIAFGFVACGKSFIVWWISETRINAYYVGAVLMLLNIMPLSVKLTIDIQRAQNMHRFRSFLYLVVAIANIGLSALLLVIMPEEQAIFACLSGTIVSNVICQWIAMNLYNAKKIKLPMKRHLLTLAKQLLFGLFGVLVTFGFRNLVLNRIGVNSLNFIFEGVVYVVTYGILLFVFDRKFIGEFIKK